MTTKSPHLIKPGSGVKLEKLPTRSRQKYKRSEARDLLRKHRATMSGMQEVLYAGEQKALLIVLQGMDTAGKDGTIRHIFSGINPQGCQVASFKVPTSLELRHDFLWRVHSKVPPRGMIGLFNRSHYEDVLSPRVHKQISKKTAERHIAEINDFESMLWHNDVTILKFFLHISKEEQGRRLQARLDDPDKYWKLSEGDFHERTFWEDYQEAYSDVISATSHKHAPWFIIPADQKWYRNLAISGILAEAMSGMKLSYPESTFDPGAVRLDGFTVPKGAVEKTGSRKASGGGGTTAS